MTDQTAMTEEQVVEALKACTDSQLVEWFLNFRAFLEREAEAQSAFVAPHIKKQSMVQNELHRRLLERNPNWQPGVKASGSTEAGTFFLKTNNSIKVGDREAFMAFLLADPANRVPTFTTAHVAKEAVEGYIEHIEEYRRTHGGALPPGVESELPPGIAIDRITQLQVRKT